MFSSADAWSKRQTAKAATGLWNCVWKIGGSITKAKGIAFSQFSIYNFNVFRQYINLVSHKLKEKKYKCVYFMI